MCEKAIEIGVDEENRFDLLLISNIHHALQLEDYCLHPIINFKSDDFIQFTQSENYKLLNDDLKSIIYQKRIVRERPEFYKKSTTTTTATTTTTTPIISSSKSLVITSSSNIYDFEIEKKNKGETDVTVKPFVTPKLFSFDGSNQIDFSPNVTHNSSNNNSPNGRINRSVSLPISNSSGNSNSNSINNNATTTSYLNVDNKITNVNSPSKKKTRKSPMKSSPNVTRSQTPRQVPSHLVHAFDFSSFESELNNIDHNTNDNNNNNNNDNNNNNNNDNNNNGSTFDFPLFTNQEQNNGKTE